MRALLGEGVKVAIGDTRRKSIDTALSTLDKREAPQPRRILDGFHENRANICTHPDHREELRHLFDDVLADKRDYPGHAVFEQRTAFEKVRRERFAATRSQARGSG